MQENWRLEVEVAGGPRAGRHTWVLRTDAAQRLAMSLDRETEFAVLQAAFAAGVPVAEPLIRCPDPDLIGRPFFTQSFAIGAAQGRQIARDPELPAYGDRLAGDLGRALATIHAIKPANGTLPKLPIPAIAPAKVEVARLKSALASASQVRPALDYCLAWLDANAPATQQVALVHGDFRTGNYMVEGTRLSAILDWEFTHWGDPHEDIGWLCARCWRFGNDANEAGGIGSRRALYDAYNAAAALKIDEAVIPYWEVLAAVKWGVIAVLQGDRFLTGGETAIELALTGVMAPEMEFDALEGIGQIEAARKAR